MHEDFVNLTLHTERGHKGVKKKLIPVREGGRRITKEQETAAFSVIPI